MRHCLLVCLLTSVPLLSGACARKAGEAASARAPMAARKATLAEEGAAPGEESMGGMAKAADPNAYYENTYQGGFGDRERLAKLIEDGVIVDGQQIKLAAFSREYGQSFPVPTDKALFVAAETELARMVREGGKTYLQVGLQAIRQEAPSRAPLNLAIVIDRSGSMGSEQKLEFAKSAAKDAVNRLEAGDRLAIVTYDNNAKVDLPSARLVDKQRAIGVIEGLRPGNSTNIHDGLTKAYAEVRSGGLSPDAINSVILISDGIITAGRKDDASFTSLVGDAFDDGITTTTVGMGLDFSEHTMTLIAREGKGNYHFINEPSTISAIFDRELGDLTHVVAKALRLRIVLDPSVTLVRVLGSGELGEKETAETKADEKQIDRKVYEDLGIKMDRQGQPEEPGIKMVIPHFYLGDSHVVLIEIEVPEGDQTRKVADVYAKYKDLVFKKNREEHVTASIEGARDKAAMQASVRRPVRKNRLGFETGEALLGAGQLLAQSRASDAAKLVDERMVVLGVAAKEWQDPDIEKDHELLGRYQQVIASLGSGGNQELGRYLAKSLTYSGYELTR